MQNIDGRFRFSRQPPAGASESTPAKWSQTLHLPPFDPTYAAAVDQYVDAITATVKAHRPTCSVLIQALTLVASDDKIQVLSETSHVFTYLPIFSHLARCCRRSYNF
eukprot:GHVP01042707.1.p1 GENE.GHVP01042707.1~~GHVP01042707.1.p1  ORF type:complete len:107 (+),score=3.48 GHVP01042707.1:201-521(+)